MAVAQTAMRNFLSTVIGIADSPGTGTAVHARRDAVRAENLENIEDLAEFEDDDIKILCASVHKPGGTIVDPNNASSRIPNPGHSVMSISKKRLKIACYGAWIYESLGRTITSNSLSRNRLKQFKKYHATIEDHTEPEAMPIISKTFRIMKALDMLPIHLRERISGRKIAFSYVVRTNENPEPLLQLENDRITSENYPSLIDKLIARISLLGTEYNEDNAIVYIIIQDLIAGSSHESSIKTF